MRPPNAPPGSEELLRLMVESAVDYAIFSMDTEGCVTSWNVGATKVLGFGENEIMGRTADVIFTPEDQRAGVPEMERVQALAYGRAIDERWQVRQDGTRFWASGLLMPLADRAMGFVKILRDRTEAHVAEQRLRENEERFRVLATNIPQLVFRSHPDGDRTWGSPQWTAFTGLSLPESVGYGWMSAVHPEDRVATQAAWKEARERGEYYIEHRVRRHSDGEYRWHQTRAKPVEGASPGADWVGTMTDIHDLKRLQDTQRMLLGELQHRTRNLLAVTQALATQTLSSSDSLQGFGVQFASRLRALGRVQGLLERSSQLVDLRDLIAAELAARGLTPGELVQVEGPAVLLDADPTQALGLALHELMTNAVKHGALAHEGGRISIDWQLTPEAKGRHLRFQWKESGVAIPEPPKRQGFGSELIEKALPYQLDAETKLTFEPDGVRCRIGMTMPDTGEDNG